MAGSLIDPHNTPLSEIIAAAEASPIKGSNPPTEIGDRFSGKLMLHFEQKGEQPISVDLRFSDHIPKTDEPYVRRLNLAAEWQPIDFGWVKNPGTLLIHNKGEKPVKFSTVWDDPSPMLIRPGKFVIVGVYPGIQLFTSAEAPTPVNLHVFPG